MTDNPAGGDRELLFVWVLFFLCGGLLLHLNAHGGIWAAKKSLCVSEKSWSACLLAACQEYCPPTPPPKKKPNNSLWEGNIQSLRTLLELWVRWHLPGMFDDECQTAPSTGSKKCDKAGPASHRCTCPRCWQFRGKDSCRGNTEDDVIDVTMMLCCDVTFWTLTLPSPQTSCPWCPPRSPWPCWRSSRTWTWWRTWFCSWSRAPPLPPSRPVGACGSPLRLAVGTGSKVNSRLTQHGRHRFVSSPRLFPLAGAPTWLGFDLLSASSAASTVTMSSLFMASPPSARREFKAHLTSSTRVRHWHIFQFSRSINFCRALSRLLHSHKFYYICIELIRSQCCHLFIYFLHASIIFFKPKKRGKYSLYSALWNGCDEEKQSKKRLWLDPFI